MSGRAEEELQRQTADREGSAPASITIRRRIEWADTDASGHYHVTAVLHLAEAAEGALLEQLGLWDTCRKPRVRVEANFARPLYFGNTVSVHLWVSEIGETSITFRFGINHGDELAAEGAVVAVRLDSQTMLPSPWPETHRAVLLSAGPQPDPLVQ